MRFDRCSVTVLGKDVPMPSPPEVGVYSRLYFTSLPWSNPLSIQVTLSLHDGKDVKLGLVNPANWRVVTVAPIHRPPLADCLTAEGGSSSCKR